MTAAFLVDQATHLGLVVALILTARAMRGFAAVQGVLVKTIRSLVSTANAAPKLTMNVAGVDVDARELLQVLDANPRPGLLAFREMLRHAVKEMSGSTTDRSDLS